MCGYCSMTEKIVASLSAEDIKKFVEIVLKGIAVTVADDLEFLEKRLVALKKRLGIIETTLVIRENDFSQKNIIDTNSMNKETFVSDDITNKKRKRKIDEELAAALKLIDST